jgi:hypothetical protein
MLFLQCGKILWSLAEACLLGCSADKQAFPYSAQADTKSVIQQK